MISANSVAARRAPVALVFAFLGSSAAVSQQAENTAPLAGLWTAERTFGPEVGGPVVIRRVDGELWAEIGGRAVRVDSTGRGIRFDLAGDRGHFRGSISAAGDSIRGHWVQPWNYSSFSRLATPVTLVRRSDDAWVGTATPLRDRLRFQLAIERSDGGGLAAFLRNPEANLGRFYPIHEVSLVGSDVRFLDAQGQVRLEGKYHADHDRLSVYFPRNGGTYDFTRDDAGTAPFLPRDVASAEYRYRRPLAAEGWESARAEDVGMATEPLVELVRRIAATPIDALEAPYIHGFLIARDGKLILEEYFHGLSRHDPHGTRSASKAVTATLVGVGEHAGLLSREASVFEAMLGTPLPAGLDVRARALTLEHLITNTSGLACDDFDPDSPGSEDAMQNQDEQPDWFGYMLELPFVHPPGTHAAYCSGGLNLAGGVVSRISGEWLPNFFRDRFADPLGMGTYHVNLTPTGEAYGGGGLYIRPRDFLKLGQLYLDDGVWKDRRLLDEGWAAEATTPRFLIRDEGYGYGWWVISYPFEGRRVDAFYAGGNGGQYVIVVPELSLNIAILGGNYNQPVMHVPKYDYVPEYVLRSVEVGRR